MRKKLYLVSAILVAALIAGVAFAQTSTSSTVSVSTGGVNGGDFANALAASAANQLLRYQDYSDGTPKYTDPSWTPIVDAAGNITAGDLYWIDSTNYTGDVRVSLHVTNPVELQKNYSYMLMKINVYKLTSVTDEQDAAWATDWTANGDTLTALDHIPLNYGSETVTTSAGDLVKDTDYSIDYSTGVITMLRDPAVDEAATLVVDYTYWAQAERANGSGIGTVYLTLNNGSVSFILSGDAKYAITMDDGTFYCIDTDATGGSLSPQFYLAITQA